MARASRPLLAGRERALPGGALLITVCANVPRNTVMAALDPNSAESVRLWTDYLEGWTAWNHVRAVAALRPPCALAIAYRRV